MLISIICPVYNEEKYIEGCIESLLRQNTRYKYEIIFIDGGSTDKTLSLIKQQKKFFPGITVLNNPKKIVPVALNLGIEKAKGDIVMRVDAHASYPEDYLQVLVTTLLQHPEIDNVGAICRTEVKGLSSTANAIRLVLSSPIGVGNSQFRTGVSSDVYTDTVPFGCFRKSIFKKIGYFNEKLERNQDIEFNKRIIKNNGKVLLTPKTFCIYYAQNSYKKLAIKAYANGKWNIITIKVTKNLRSISLRHFVPLFFFIGIFALIVFTLLSIYGLILAITLVSIYIIAIYYSVRNVIRHAPASFLDVFIAFFIMHFYYGCGSFVGLLTKK